MKPNNNNNNNNNNNDDDDYDDDDDDNNNFHHHHHHHHNRTVGAIQKFYNVLTAPRTVSLSRATHREIATCNMYATWHGGTAQLLSLTEFKFHLFKI